MNPHRLKDAVERVGNPSSGRVILLIILHRLMACMVMVEVRVDSRVLPETNCMDLVAESQLSPSAPAHAMLEGPGVQAAA